MPDINRPLLYVCVEHDESPTSPGAHYAFTDLEGYLQGFNDALETNYSSIEEFNQGEEYRTIYVTEMPT